MNALPPRQSAHNSARNSARGFSLLEVIIAVGLLAVIGTMMVSALSSSSDAKERVENISGRYHAVRQAMGRMVREVSLAYLSAHRSPLETRAETGFLGERDKLSFSAFGYVPRVEDSKQSDQQEITYFIGDDPKTRTRSIIRRQQADLDENFEEGGREQTLLTDVISLELAYWDIQSESWQEKWDAESSATQGRLPPRVRIKLTVKMDDGSEQTFMSQSRIQITTPLSF